MIRRRTITSYVWNSVSGNKMVILSNCIRNFFRKFELIGNSTQGENPAPDNPQEIKSAGRKSKNLFNIADLRVGQVQKDGTINEKSTHSRTAILDVPEDGKYRIAFNSNDDYTMLYFAEMYTNGVYSQPYVRVHAGNSNSLISLKKGKNILSFSTYNNNTQVDFPKDHNIMIAAESETLGYEPYGYLLDVKVTGENLLDMADIQNENGKIDSDFSKAKSIKPFKVIKDRKYLLISKGTMIVDVRYSSIYFGEDDLAYGQDSSRKLTTGVGYSCFIGTETRKILVAKETCTITKTMMHGTRTEKDAYEVEELGLFEIINDNPNIDYQPYTEQSMQIVLNEPLRGVGEYKDVLTKDGVVRRILEAPLVKYLKPVINGNVGNRYVFAEVPNANINYDRERCMSNVGFTNSTEKKKYIPHPYQLNFLIRVADDDTIEMVKEKIKDIIVAYTAKEPITEPLPESVQAQLSALHSENGTTHVFVVSGEVECGINIEYKYKS